MIENEVIPMAEQAQGVRDAITILYAEALLDEHEVGLRLAAAARTLEGATEPPMTGTTIEAQIGHMQTAIAHAYRCSNMESIVALDAALATLRWVQSLQRGHINRQGECVDDSGAKI